MVTRLRSVAAWDRDRIFYSLFLHGRDEPSQRTWKSPGWEGIGGLAVQGSRKRTVSDLC